MYIAEAMISAAKKIGFSNADARSLIAHTFIGSGRLLLATSKTPNALAEEVMTPNGTTERGVRLLKQNNIFETLENALLAASARANELSKIDLE